MRQPSESEQTIRTALFEKAANPRIGIPASEAQSLLQTDSFQELVNKFAWVLGSTYRVPYCNVRTPARKFAIKLATRTQQQIGYPAQIGHPKN